MYNKNVVELDGLEGSLPNDLIKLPMLNYYAIRNAVNTSSFDLSSFDYFQDKLMPKHCLDMTDEDRKGPQQIFEIFNHKILENYLEKATKPWTYEWQV